MCLWQSTKYVHKLAHMHLLHFRSSHATPHAVQVAGIYVLMLQFACQVTQNQQRLLRVLVKLAVNPYLPPDVGAEAAALLVS